MKTQQIKIGNTRLNVKLAQTGREQAHGLMHTADLPKGQGMLFSYPQEKILTFWMKNTTIPLSIAFIDQDKKIIQIEDMEPLSDKSVKSSDPVMWALEVNKGWFSDNKIKVGDKCDIAFVRDIKIRVLKLGAETPVSKDVRIGNDKNSTATAD
jgi:uncharacterized membrane protein (UPF0127 family)